MAPNPRIAELRLLLEQANFAYYVDMQPTMADSEFDKLLQELIDLEEMHPDQFDPNSPTQRVGGQAIEGFETVTHQVPMQSIDNTYSLAGFQVWYERVVKLAGEDVVCTCDPKIDGVAISLRYEQGVLVSAVTRGDGERGDNVTAQVKTVRSVPLRLRGTPPSVLEVRGEIFMPNTSFEAINEQRQSEGDALFANARNATAGTLKSLDPTIVAKRKLAFLAHGKGEVHWEGMSETWSTFVAAIRTFGIPTSDRLAICHGASNIEELIASFASERHSLGYGVDGMVIRVDDFSLQQKLGSTSKSPRWCIAYKYPAEQGKTLLLQVDWQVGKNGTLTPRATMEPILLAGTTVQHATLHNIEEIHRKDIRVGDIVIVEKAGEIIPQVVEALASERDGTQVVIQPPRVCPTCTGFIEQEGPKLYCRNPECPAQFREKVKWFVARDQMDIDGLGEKVVDQLIDADLVHHFADLYKLTVEDILPLEGFAEKSATSLVEAIEKSKDRGFARVLAAVGICLIGRATSKIVAHAFPNIEVLQQASVEDFIALPDFGKITAKTLHASIHSKQGVELFRKLTEVGVVLKNNMSISLDPTFAGKTIVITGTLQEWERKSLTEELENRGAKVTNSVSKLTDILIAGSKAGSKLKKATELEVEVWDETQLMRVLSK